MDFSLNVGDYFEQSSDDDLARLADLLRQVIQLSFGVFFDFETKGIAAALVLGKTNQIRRIDKDVFVKYLYCGSKKGQQDKNTA